MVTPSPRPSFPSPGSPEGRLPPTPVPPIDLRPSHPEQPVAAPHDRAPSPAARAAQTLAPAELPSRIAVVRMPLTEFAKRAAVAVGIATIAVGVMVFLWIGASLLALLFAGVLLGVLLRALASVVERWLGIGPSWSLGVVILAIAGVIFGGGFWVAPSVVQQVGRISEVVPQSVEGLERRLADYRAGRWLLTNMPAMDTIMPQPGRLVDRVTGLLTGTLGLVVSALVVLFVGVYLAATPGIYSRGVVLLVPEPHRARAEQLMSKLYETLKWWLIGKGIAMAVVGALTWIGLWAVGMELAFTLAVFTALVEFIPNFGPYIGAAPAVLVAAAEGPEMVAWVIGVFVAVQTIESYVLTPVIQHRTVHLPPALTIAAQLVLGVLLGAIGVIVAAPVTAAGMVIVKELYVKETLGDGSVTEDEPKGEHASGRAA